MPDDSMLFTKTRTWSEKNSAWAPDQMIGVDTRLYAL